MCSSLFLFLLLAITLSSIVSAMKHWSNVVILGAFPVEVITEQLLTKSEFVILDKCFLFCITILYSTFFLAIQVSVRFPKIVSTGTDRQLPKSNASEALWKDRPSSSICAMLRTMEPILASSGKKSSRFNLDSEEDAIFA